MPAHKYKDTQSNAIKPNDVQIHDHQCYIMFKAYPFTMDFAFHIDNKKSKFSVLISAFRGHLYGL